jgi:hypothetical protein
VSTPKPGSKGIVSTVNAARWDHFESGVLGNYSVSALLVSIFSLFILRLRMERGT